MSQRINVVISDEMNIKLNEYSERYGVSKSSISAFVIGQWLDNMERLNSTVYGATGSDGIIASLFSNIEK
ncbi:hypothetical protein KQH81_17520 (plasmid) [Clostridium cadaveris]|uniref:hypothetical protein n=1 Tax=Clostridium cadaveris TaxID=1529 RepID=UPI001E62AB6E|nr:hypothetical protein [Clostridium cadaveris]UFH66758.1 hypothetical protein KQH81_17520 [Clostridium cadaveris]